MPFPPDLHESFAARAAAVSLRAEDVDEHFILGSGHGGQNRNKRATAVQLVHHPTGTEIRCFHRRQQHQNRMDAWMTLLEKLEERKRDIEGALAHREYVEKAQKRKRSHGAKKEMLRDKKVRGEIKQTRKPIV
ncbi:peptide chain release factor-like protein [Candidatus Peribacteria bacterium]|nr:peptide chain release factor-like protein [Candidatus Peribacteria bacterium]